LCCGCFDAACGSPSACCHPEPLAWPSENSIEENLAGNACIGGHFLDDVGLSGSSSSTSEVGDLLDFRDFRPTFKLSTDKTSAESDDPDDGTPVLANCSKESRSQAKGSKKRASAVKKLFKMPEGLPKGLRHFGPLNSQKR